MFIEKTNAANTRKIITSIQRLQILSRPREGPRPGGGRFPCCARQFPPWPMEHNWIQNFPCGVQPYRAKKERGIPGADVVSTREQHGCRAVRPTARYVRNVRNFNNKALCGIKNTTQVGRSFRHWFGRCAHRVATPDRVDVAQTSANTSD